jgi:hypothetical protein
VRYLETWLVYITTDEKDIAKITYFLICNLCATFSSRLGAAGVPDVFITQMLGHAGGLLETYSKAIPEYQRDAIRKLKAFRESANVTPPVNLSSDGPIQ